MRIKSGWYEEKGMLSDKNEKNVQKIDINIKSFAGISTSRKFL